jgi:hypothetical protein
MKKLTKFQIDTIAKMSVKDASFYMRQCEYNDAYILSLSFQESMTKHGIAWHNNIFGECTNDFGCCTNNGNYHTRIPEQ